MGCGNSLPTKSNNYFRSPTNVEQEISDEKQIFHQENQEKTGQLNLFGSNLPIYLSHVKSGNTLSANNNVLLIQDGSTAIEFRLPPKFHGKLIPWRFGLIRDIVWCSDLDLFILLTKDALFNISPKSLLIPETALDKPLENFTINAYKKIKPRTNNLLFWRCTCAGTTLYITSAGHGPTIDEYSLEASSSKFIHRWTPPETCAIYEDIWSIRYHPDTNQLGLTIMDTRNEEWRIEVRSREKLDLLWKTVLPLTNGDCELSPLPNGEWLAINACGLRLIHVAKQEVRAAAEYQRELRNAVLMNNLYFIIRTKNTVEIHQCNESK